MGEKKRVWEKHFLCALTSSLDELELELPSWPHLRATTWAEVSNIRTLLTQENDGWRGEKGERKVLLIFCSQKKQASLSICYSLFGFLRITRHCHVTAFFGKKQICSTHSVPVSSCQGKQWAASVCQHVSCPQLGYQDFIKLYVVCCISSHVLYLCGTKFKQTIMKWNSMCPRLGEIRCLTTKKPGLKAHVWGSLAEAFGHSVSLMPNVMSRSTVFRPMGITWNTCDICHNPTSNTSLRLLPVMISLINLMCRLTLLTEPRVTR